MVLKQVACPRSRGNPTCVRAAAASMSFVFACPPRPQPPSRASVSSRVTSGVGGNLGQPNDYSQLLARPARLRW